MALFGFEGSGLLPPPSPLGLSGLPSHIAYTPYWSSSFRSGALLGSSSSGSSSACSVVYRGRGPEPSALLSCYLGGFKLDDRAQPLGRNHKNATNPLLEVEVVNAVGVCYFENLLTDHPLSICTQPACCCCFAKLPSDPDPYGLSGEGKKAAAAAAAASGRKTTVVDELVPYAALSDTNTGRTPLLVLPCGAAHSALELVAVTHKVEDVVYSRDLPRSCMRRGITKSSVKQGALHKNPSRTRSRRSSSRSSSGSSSRSSSGSSSTSSSTSSRSQSDIENDDSASPTPYNWAASLNVAGCSLGVEGRCLAELHPHTFQWTRGEEGSPRPRSRGSQACAGRGLLSCCCCTSCCWCPMGAEVDEGGQVRNIFANEEARHAPNPIDTIKPKESVVSERLLEVRTDDKHPFIKLIYARNRRGLYVAKLKHSDEALDPEEAQAALREAGARGGDKGAFGKAVNGAPDQFCEGAVRRQLEVQVLHDTPYGFRVPKQEGGLKKHKDKETGALRWNVPKQIPCYSTIVNIAVSPQDVGEAAMLYSSQFVGLWKAEEARMEVEVPVSLSVGSHCLRRVGRPTLRYRQRTAAADPSAEAFQTLCYLPHQRQTLLLGSDNLWALDFRAKGITRVFPALHAPTHGSTLQCVAETFYAPCTANSNYHTAFTALAPHPTHPFLLAAAHDAAECICMFDIRAMHEPLTVVALPTIRKTGARYRSLVWHSSSDKWAVAYTLDPMHPTSFRGSKARAAAVATAGSPDQGAATHDLLAAFSWRSEDVVCSAFRVHPAFCPTSPSHTSLQQGKQEEPLVGKDWEGSGTSKQSTSSAQNDNSGPLRQRPCFEPSPLEAVRSGCLPKVVEREVVEVSWQAEVSMFPRVSWGIENRERCHPIPSRTPVGSCWTQQPPWQVTVDEHAATSTFHGFAGACFFELPITSETREALVFEGRATQRCRLRCRACGHRNLQQVPSSAAPSFCESCSAPISRFVGTSQEASGSLSLLAAFTTSGRLTCRPLTLNDPILQLKLQRRRRIYAALATRQRLSRENEACADDMDVTSWPQSVKDLYLFHRGRTSHQKTHFLPVCAAESVSEESESPGATYELLRQLQASPNEARVLPQRIPSLLLQVQLQQGLQRDLLFRGALKWKRRQQLLLLRRAQLEGHFGPCASPEFLGAEILQILRQGFAAMKISVKWPGKLASFGFWDSGSLGVHKPAFLKETYDPEPIVQVLLSDPHLEAHLLHSSGFSDKENAEGPSETEGAGQAHLGLTTTHSAVPPDVRDVASGRTQGSLASSGTFESNCRVDSSLSLWSRDRNNTTLHSGNCRSSGSLTDEQKEERVLRARATTELLASELQGPGFSAQAEVSALPFPTARSRAVFRYAVEAVETLSYANPEKSLLQLRDQGSALLHDVLVAVQLWRERVLTDEQALRLLRPFTLSRPCSAGLLGMQRTTLPLGVPLPRTPQEALEAAVGTTNTFNTAPTSSSAVHVARRSSQSSPSWGRSTAIDSEGPLGDKASDAVAARANSFRKIANPALTPGLPCCCRVLLQHHCDVHSLAQGRGGGVLMTAPEGGFAGTQYPQTDGMQALLQVLKAEHERWLRGLAAQRSGTPLSNICFLPQAIVDELAEALFLTHEVLLLPTNASKNKPSENSKPNRKGNIANKRTTDHHHQSAVAEENTSLEVNPGDRGEGRSTGGTDCPVGSPWLPPCCLSRHLHMFIRSDKLLADDDQLQEELQRRAWPELRRIAEGEGNARTQHFSQYPYSPPLQLPDSMKAHLPAHVLEGLERSKWGRLIAGIAVNDVIIADVLHHWDVPAVQRLREERDEQRDRRVESQLEAHAARGNRDATAAVQSLPGDAAGPVPSELNRLLGLLPENAEGSPVFASVQARQQEQRRLQTERQQLLDTIERCMRQ